MRFDLDALCSSQLQLPLEAIEEDPLQPRREFDPEALQQLADTIAERGVLQAVSVRHHPDQPERYILNFGARRLRASRLAGKPSIPAFIDDRATSYDQVIENEQREGLTPLELALFIERRMEAGDSQAEIARRLGKSRPYVTYASALIDAPDWLMTLYREGRCRGLLELHELRQLQLRCPEAVRRLESDREPITRQRIATIKAALVEEGKGSPTPAAEDLPANTPSVAGSISQTERVEAPGRDAVVGTFVNAAQPGFDPTLAYALLAHLDGRVVEVVVDCAPSEDGSVFVETNANSRLAVHAGDLKLIRLVPRPAR